MEMEEGVGGGIISFKFSCAILASLESRPFSKMVSNLSGPSLKLLARFIFIIYSVLISGPS